MEHIEGMIYINSDNPYDYQKYVIEFYRQKSHRQDLEPLKRLVDLYGDQWQDAQFKVLDELSQIMTKESLQDILNKFDCLPYKIYSFLKKYHFYGDEYYEDVIKKKNLQMYIYYLEDFYSTSVFYSYDYRWIGNHLKWKFKGIDSKEIREEFVYDMIQKRPNDKKFHYALLEFLEEANT